MNETAKAQNVDTDLPFYCAYSLPGVALTLGRRHWPMLKPTFDVLAADMHVSKQAGHDIYNVLLYRQQPMSVQTTYST